MKKVINWLGIALTFLWSCNNYETLDIETISLETQNEKFTFTPMNGIAESRQYEKVKTRLLLSLAKDESRVSELIEGDHVKWEEAFYISQGIKEGYIVMTDLLDSNSFSLLIFLEVNSVKNVYVADYVKEFADGIKQEKIVVSNRYNQIVLERNYSNNHLVYEYELPFTMTKCELCEHLGPNHKATFGDYSGWFDLECGEQRLGNATDHRIWYKPEDGICGANDYLDPNEWTTNRVDGYNCEGQVYKLCNNYNTCLVLGQHSQQTAYNAIYQIIQNLLGGEKDEEWLQELHNQTPPDTSWDTLFNH